jgi:hypothetical protein
MKQLEDYITGLNLIITAGIGEVRCVVGEKWHLLEEIEINEEGKCLDVRCFRCATKNQINLNTEFKVDIKDVPKELQSWVDTKEIILYYHSDEAIIEKLGLWGYRPKIFIGKSHPEASQKDYPSPGWKFCHNEENEIISFDTYRKAEEYLLEHI